MIIREIKDAVSTTFYATFDYVNDYADTRQWALINAPDKVERLDRFNKWWTKNLTKNKSTQYEGCTCVDWEIGISQLNSHITMSKFRAAGPGPYTGPVFRVCPWCGTELKEK